MMRARAKSAGVGHPSSPRPVSPGQPENPLPRWYHLPLDAKIPLPRVVPKGKAIMYPAVAGEPLWRTLPVSLGPDLDDPLLMQLPGPHEYNPLHDPFASGHLRRPDLQDALYCHGLVTRQGFCLSSLKNFNKFRQYLHSVNLRQLKHKRTEVELPLRTEYEHLALDVVREERRKEEEREPETATEGAPALSARYSDIMRDEESKLPDHLPDFFSVLTNKEKIDLNDENKTFATIRFAKIQNRESRLAAIKSWLRKDGRKGALLRLRKLQIMEERRKKGINNWKTRTAVQSEFFEELKVRELREMEARRIHLAEKQRYLSAIGFVHNIKYDDVVQKWRLKRLRSPAAVFCGYGEGLQDAEPELADAEIQTDPSKSDLLLDKEKTILFDRSSRLTHDITDGFSADEVREYERDASEHAQSAVYIHSEIIVPATSRYKAELERRESEDRGHDTAVQTTDSLQHMDPIIYRPDPVIHQPSTEVVQQEEEAKQEPTTCPVHFDDSIPPDGQKSGYASSCQSTAGSSSYKREIVFSTTENEVLRVEKEKDEPTDKVEMLEVALDALEKVTDGPEEDSLDECGGGPIHRLLTRGREVLAEAIDIRRNSSEVVEEIVRLAIDDISRQLQETTADGQTEGRETQSVAKQRRSKGSRRQVADKALAKCKCPGPDLLMYVVGKAVAIAQRRRSDEGAQDDSERSGEKDPEVGDDGDEFTEAFLKRINGGEEEEEEEATTAYRSSALVSACDDLNDALCDRYAWMDLNERELIQLAKDRTTNEASRLVTTSFKTVLEDLRGGEEGLDVNDTVTHVEASRAIAETLLNLALHRDLDQMTRGYKDPHQIIDLVARIVRTHESVRDSATFAFRSAIGEQASSSYTRWHLGSILLTRLIKAALSKATVEPRACELTDEILISLAAAVDLKGLASKVVLVQPKKGRVRRRCPRQPPLIDQTTFRSALIDSFTDRMKQLVDLSVLPDTCVDHALLKAIQMAASTSSLVPLPKRHSQQETALLTDVKSIVADAARVVLRRTVGTLASKFRATNEFQVESVLGQVESALSDIDAYGLLSNESQLGLRARNSIDLSRDRLKLSPSSTLWTVAERVDSEDDEVNDRVTRKLSGGTKVVRVTLVPTESEIIHEPYLSPIPGDSPMPPRAVHSAIKASPSHPSSAVEGLVDDLSVIPMFGNVPLDIDPNLVTEDLLVLSVKNDEDLDSSALSMRNSFRNIHRPDVSGMRRFSSSSSTASGPGSIHDRVKGVFIQRRSTLEDDSHRPIPKSDNESEYVINKVTIPVMDSIPEFWPIELIRSSYDAPDQSTVTTEYSKKYDFPEDVKPLKSGQLTLKSDKAPDEISMISFLYGDPHEFHNLKVSSMITDDADSMDLSEDGRANATQKRRDLLVPQPHNVDSDGKSVLVDESEEIVMVTREIFDASDLINDDSSQEFSKKQIDGANGILMVMPVSKATSERVTPNLEAAATELEKHDSSADTSTKRHLGKSTDSLILPPAPANSKEIYEDIPIANTPTNVVITVTPKPLGEGADINSGVTDLADDAGKSNE